MKNTPKKKIKLLAMYHGNNKKSSTEKYVLPLFLALS